MSKIIKNKKIVVVLVLIYIIVMGQIVQAFAGEPGSSTDPLVTKSYVDNQISLVKAELATTPTTTPTPAAGTGETTASNAEITSLLNKIDVLTRDLLATQAKITSLESSIQNDSNIYTIVVVEAGKAIYFGGSVEVIVRSGEATAIASESGGLADITNGVDLNTGNVVPKNHLIVISRNDGRGMIAKKELYLLIKGAYTII